MENFYTLGYDRYISVTQQKVFSFSIHNEVTWYSFHHMAYFLLNMLSLEVGQQTVYVHIRMRLTPKTTLTPA